MTDRPIIFSAPMVRALLDGRKTQTRRLAWGDASFVGNRSIEPGEHITMARLGSTPAPLTHRPTVWQRVQPGDRLWVRETWQTGTSINGPQITFRATPDYFNIDAWDGPDEGIGPSFNYERCPGASFSHALPDVLADDGPWRSPIHMPRWASRLTLTVTEVRRERLQEISGADAYDEGATTVFPASVELLDLQPPRRRGAAMKAWEAEFTRRRDEAFRDSFRKLWCSLHGDDAWESNPTVVALTFTVARRNIDAAPEEPPAP